MALDDMTYPQGRTLVWHSILLSREYTAGFVCICERAVIQYVRQVTYTAKAYSTKDFSNATYL